MPLPMNPAKGGHYIPERLEWVKLQEIPPKRYKCYSCDSEVASKEGYQVVDLTSTFASCGIYICPKCNIPTYFNRDDTQTPKPIFGERLSSLPANVELLYNEARSCYGFNAYTSTVTNCRTLLAYVAVDKGAETNQSFKFYVEYLRSEHWVSNSASGWVDEIRNLGNVATHDLVVMEEHDARLILLFTTALLKDIYELPSLLKAKSV